MELLQKDMGDKRRFIIQDNGLKIEDSSWFGKHQRTIPFEFIDDEIISLNFTPKKWIAIITMLILSLIGAGIIRLIGFYGEWKVIYYLIVGVFSGLLGIIFNRKNQLIIKCFHREGIELMKNEPSKKEFEDFVEKLFKKRKEVLMEKYGKISKHIDFESQLNNFYWLHNLGVIDKTQLEELVIELDKTFNKRPNPIGFKFNKFNKN